MRASAQTVVAAPIETVWEVVCDPERAQDFMSGVTRWEVSGDQASDIGARYGMLLRIGTAEVGGLIYVAEFYEPGELAYTAVKRTDERGGWRLRPAPGGRT